MSVNKKLANAGEETAARVLRGLGVKMVQEVGTPFVITARNNEGWLRGYFKTKVTGDLIGHTQSGTMVLAEVKTIWDRNLTWSDFKDHQPEKLTENSECAISLVVWVHNSGVYVMNWTDLLEAGFRKGKGIDIETAQTLDMENYRWANT